MPDFTCPIGVPATDPVSLSDGLSTGAAGKHLNVTAQTVGKWIRSGYIRGYRVGPRNYIVPRSEVDRVLAEAGAL